jgi:Rad3-related DNA helicase
MERLKFDSQGKLMGVDGSEVFTSKEKNLDIGLGKKELKKRIHRNRRIIENSNDTEYWSLFRDGKRLEPLRFSNGKTQEDVVKEVVDLIKGGRKCVFLHGMCGTGKSAIALNIARVLGKAAIVVPVKNLQKQYEEDYMGRMCVAKTNGEELGIDMITGRNNHDSIIEPGKSCGDMFLPDTIQITEKNFDKIQEYYKENPLIKSSEVNDLRQIRRISIAPANPYWSPIIPAEYDINLSDAVKKRYLGMSGKEFIFYHRKRGCSYYDQYQSYLTSDVIIFNSAKYKIEVSMDRKPATKVDIIDEADEFLDGFSNQSELNLTRLDKSLKNVISLDPDVRAIIDTIREMISLEEKNKRSLGIDENEVFHIRDTKLGSILNLFLKNRNVESEVSMDDANYANRGIEASKEFIDFIEDTYLTYRKHEDNLIVNLVTTNLSKRLKEVIDKNEAFVFMSGTLHSKEVLNKVFGITDYAVVEAETKHQGEIEIFRTGKEKDFSYRSFKEKLVSREDYLRALASCVKWAEKPLLVHVNAYEDLPKFDEQNKYRLGELMTKEQLSDLQNRDKTGRIVSMFKSGLSDSLYSTKCSRGVDFPGDVCKSMIFTKYPNPNIRGTFWKILMRTHKEYFWDFYKDKANREFLQRLYRALRSKEDHVFVMSPDLRVLDAVVRLQNGKV